MASRQSPRKNPPSNESQSLLGSEKKPMYASSAPKSAGSITDYESISRLGQGSFGSVFLHEEKSTKKRFAIKECYKFELMKKHMTHLVMRERKALARLNHDFIIKLHKAFQDRFAVYFVMDYMPNGSLQEKLEKYGAFPNDVTRFYSAELIMAIEYMQQQGVVHRDIKSENLLLDEQMHIRLSDFGICAFMSIDEGSGSEYSDGKLDKFATNMSGSPARRPLRRARQRNNTFGAGTHPNIAPEVIDSREYTYGTDLWCLGCLIYEWHAGRPAFENASHDHIRKGHYRKMPAGSDPAISDLIKQLLRTDPNHRIGLGEDGMVRLKNHIFYGTEDINDWYKLKTITPPPFTSSSELSDSRQRSGSQSSQHSLAESPRLRSPTSPRSHGGYLGPESLEVPVASPRKRGSSFITSLPKYEGASEPQNVQPPIMMNWALTKTPDNSPPDSPELDQKGRIKGTKGCCTAQ